MQHADNILGVEGLLDSASRINTTLLCSDEKATAKQKKGGKMQLCVRMCRNLQIQLFTGAMRETFEGSYQIKEQRARGDC